jgi:N-acyl-D-amino-acid deacylase
MIDEAVAEGLDITIDAYPYIACSTTTLSAIPPKFLDKSPAAFAKSLEDPAVVEAIRHEIYEVNDPSWDNSMYYVGLENFLIVRAAGTPWAVGKTYAQAAAELGMEPFDGMIHLQKANKGDVFEVRFAMCEENVEMILKHPRCMVGSDSAFIPGNTSCHPRVFGTFPRYLGRYIRERGILPREEGIHRITGMPAKVYGLKNKGLIREGFDADLVLFDYDRIIDRADFMNPFQLNEGIHQVYVAGQLVLEDNVPTGRWCGKYLVKE